MLPDLANDLVTLYQTHKDVAGPVAGSIAGSLAYPAGRLLCWAGGQMISAGRRLMTPRPPEPLEEAVGLLLDKIERAFETPVDVACKGKMVRQAALFADNTWVCGDMVRVGPNWTMAADVPYEKGEKKAIRRAYDARLATLREESRVALRERAALGN